MLQNNRWFAGETNGWWRHPSGPGRPDAATKQRLESNPVATPSISTTKSLIARYSSTPRGRAVMANKMTPSLRRFRDYSAVGRMAYLVESIEDGALPLYDKDPTVPAYAIGENGDLVEELISSERVAALMFVLGALPMIPFTLIREKRFDVIKRTIELGVAGIREKEDVRVFATMDAMASDSDNPHPDFAIAAPFPADAVADAISVIRQHGLNCARIFINGRDYADFMKFDRDVLDPETQQGLLRSGYLGKVYGCQVIQSRVVPVGTVYFCGEREYYGRMPIRQDLTVITADMPWAFQVGFAMLEMLGILNYNFLSQQRALITRP